MTRPLEEARNKRQFQFDQAINDNERLVIWYFPRGYREVGQTMKWRNLALKTFAKETLKCKRQDVLIGKAREEDSLYEYGH